MGFPGSSVQASVDEAVHAEMQCAACGAWKEGGWSPPSMHLRKQAWQACGPHTAEHADLADILDCSPQPTSILRAHVPRDNVCGRSAGLHLFSLLSLLRSDGADDDGYAAKKPMPVAEAKTRHSRLTAR